MSIITGANGFLLPLGAAGVMNNFSQYRGSASGMMGFLQLLSASVISLIVSISSQGNALVLAVIISAVTLIGFVVFIPILIINREE